MNSVANEKTVDSTKLSGSPVKTLEVTWHLAPARTIPISQGKLVEELPVISLPPTALANSVPVRTATA